MSNLFENTYNPDVVECLANLSNDEVFTPPELANKMIDLLPQELFSDPNTTFLDPACKSGIFLREIAKRLIVGLEDKIPDLQERLDHIYKKQLYGIAITELTSLLSRRSLYYTKYPTSVLSVSQFENIEGNILFHSIKHTWNKNRCKYCGASKKDFDRGDELESHAYEFIHTEKAEEIFNMKFDVIIGNPPYQLSDGGGTGDSAKPIYDLFIEQAKKLNPRHIIFIIPSRWMKGGKGLNKFRIDMINDRSIKYLYDYEDARECFSNLNIDGGVCYFWRDVFYEGKTEHHYKPKDSEEIISNRYLKNKFSNTVIRDYRQISIIEKTNAKKEKSFSEIVSTRKPFGIATNLFNNPKEYGYTKIPSEAFDNSCKIYGVKGNKGGAKRIIGYIDKKLLTKTDGLDKYNVFSSYAYSTTATVPPQPILARPGEACTETFLKIGDFDTEKEAINCINYITTKFFRALLFFNRIQKNLSKSTFHFIPIQDFEVEWTDKELYYKYGLTDSEIEYIENLIQPMEWEN